MMDRDALRKYFDKVAAFPLRLGVYDCVVFAADALYVGWHRDYRASLAYSDRRSAVARLRRSDGLEEAITDVIGQPVSIDNLVAGDVAFIDHPSPSVGIVLDNDIYGRYIAVKGNRVIHRFQLQAATLGWIT